LDGVFKSRGDDLVGILNGIDYARWSPSTDPHLPSHYDSEAVANKGRSKAAILRELDMLIDPTRPLIVAVHPMDAIHGADVLARAIVPMTHSGARVVVAGAGDPALERLIAEAVDSVSEDAGYVRDVSEPMQHRLIAGADAVLICSRSEPCGLVQQYAQRYGAVPIAHAVGGLRDTVVDCDVALETGTGFLFDELHEDHIVGAVNRAVGAMSQSSWGALRRRVMRLDHSWERPARRYARLYAA
jgi:starch synthase